jgi:hypothetical protein
MLTLAGPEFGTSLDQGTETAKIKIRNRTRMASLEDRAAIMVLTSVNADLG